MRDEVIATGPAKISLMRKHPIASEPICKKHCTKNNGVRLQKGWGLTPATRLWAADVNVCIDQCLPL